MKSKRHSAQGFGAVELIVALLVIILMGGLVWYAWQAKNSSVEEVSNAPTSNTEPVRQASVVKSGNFRNVGEKTGSGSVSLVKNSDETYTVRLEDDFKVQKGPALYVAFGNNNVYEDGTAFAALKEFSGKQEYKVPTNIDTDKYDSILIWCKEFSVSFTIAQL